MNYKLLFNHHEVKLLLFLFFLFLFIVNFIFPHIFPIFKKIYFIFSTCLSFPLYFFSIMFLITFVLSINFRFFIDTQ